MRLYRQVKRWHIYSALPSVGASVAGLPVGALINCCDNSGAKNLFIIAVKVSAALIFTTFQIVAFARTLPRLLRSFALHMRN